MIQAGDVIENAVTGERLVFRRTSAETNGEAVVLEAFLKPNAFGAAAHVHPSQEERFQVLRGTVGFRLGRKKVLAGPPAMQFEQLIETMFGLAADGKTNRKGMPNPLHLAVIAKHYLDDVRLPFPPAWMQRTGLALGAPLGRLLGYEATYVPAQAEVALEASV
jgi:hypothetical protein